MVSLRKECPDSFLEYKVGIDKKGALIWGLIKL